MAGQSKLACLQRYLSEGTSSAEKPSHKQPRKRSRKEQRARAHRAVIRDADEDFSPQPDQHPPPEEPSPPTREDGSGWINADSDGTLKRSSATPHDGELLGSPDVDDDGDLDLPRRTASSSLSAPPTSSMVPKDHDCDLNLTQLSQHERSATRRAAAHKDDDGDLEVPRHHDTSQSPHPPAATPEDDDGDLDLPRRKSQRSESDAKSGAPGGVVSGKEFGEQVRAQRQRERDALLSDPDASGATADTMRRDEQTGERITLNEYKKRKAERAKQEQRKEEARRPEWGSGVKQKRDAEKAAAELRKEASKPFARRPDDPELEAERRAKVRWGDPMDSTANKSKSQGQGDNDVSVPDLSASHEELLRSTFKIPREVPEHSWLKRKVSPPPNRFDIKPGKMWDGIDRSNGFELQHLKRVNERRAREREEVVANQLYFE